MKKIIKKLSILSFILGLVFALAACNAESSGGSGGDGEKAGGKVIKIGAIFAETGPASTLGKTQANYVKLLQKQLDEAGPINGKKIEIVMQDYETDDTKAVVAADKLISEGVVAVVGATQASTSMAILPKISGAGIPLMTVAPVNPATKNIYQMAPSNSTSAKLIIKFLKENNISKVAWINARDGFGVDGLPPFEKAAKENKIEIVAHEEFDATATDMTVQLTNIRKKNPEAVIVWSRTPGAGIVARNFKTLGFDIPMIQSSASANQGFLDQVKDNNENLYVIGSKLSVVDQLADSEQKERLNKFREEYRAMFNSDPDNFTAHAADGFHLIIEAIKAGNTTPAKIHNYLKKEVGKYPGLTGTFELQSNYVGPYEDGFAVLGIENNKWKYRD
ncbi:ABC transporter substrate-binding protein [Neobacillus drentensis]|uniref:ABC transporter substrate-binding protein n=1 Tax=Neobacillus drentensis TaxID=220684 RepID=UPI001F2185E6|nr:ABC transporter substrate-binding protein [Neobacillus drentensis]ULT58842.1 ABC transporter substrate-binding protein [Neobacillus drentensis]